MKNKLPKYRDRKVQYIICPNIKCKGFEQKPMWCTTTEHAKTEYTDLDLHTCPHADKAKRMVLCYYGHETEVSVTHGSWHRVECKEKGCFSMLFQLMSDTTIRIAVEDYEEFKKLPLK